MGHFSPQDSNNSRSNNLLFCELVGQPVIFIAVLTDILLKSAKRMYCIYVFFLNLTDRNMLTPKHRTIWEAKRTEKEAEDAVIWAVVMSVGSVLF